jgi:pathogenesis-related protein 1
MKLPSKNSSLLTIGALALAVAVAGCSSASDTLNGFLQDSGGAGVGNADDGSSGSGGGSSSGSGGAGSTGGSSGGSSSGGSGSSSGGSSGSGSGSSSGGSSGSSSGGSSGSSGGGGSSGADAGNQGTPDSGGSAPDATTSHDASGSTDTGSPGADASGLCADQAAWLTPMNAARAAVNAGEPPLVCDPIAVQVALNYANKCMYAHNANRSADYTALGGTGGLGENIAAGAPTQSISGAVTSWLNEAPNYNHATNTCAAGQVCGHYTQIVWKATTGVGCAHVSCTTNSPFGTFSGGKWDFSVCDFNPPGNFVGRPPY